MKKIWENQIFKRSFFSIVLLLIVLPGISITYFLNGPGMVIGSIFYILIGMIGLYEVLRLMGINKYLSLFMTTSIPLFFILPWKGDVLEIDSQGFYNLIAGDKLVLNSDFSNLVNWTILDWRPWIVLVLYFFLPILLDEKFRESPSFKFDQWILLFLIPLTAVFSKMAWLININNIWFLVFFISIAVVSDVSAYFGGMTFGRKWFYGKKLAPNISPKKTMAGFVISVTLTSIFTILVGYYIHVWASFGDNEIAYTIIFGFILAFIPTYGDLFFSLIKRKHSTKDYSNLIPGHGGIYDRLDAMSFIFLFLFIILAFNFI